MSDQPTQSAEETSDQTNSWKDVGAQFEQLGASLASAFRAAWNDEENRKQARELQNGLENMIDQVSSAIKDAANSPEGEKVRSEATRAADSLRTASEQTVQEVRPHLVNALKQINSELQNIVERMERK